MPTTLPKSQRYNVPSPTDNKENLSSVLLDHQVTPSKSTPLFLKALPASLVNEHRQKLIDSNIIASSKEQNSPTLSPMRVKPPVTADNKAQKLDKILSTSSLALQNIPDLLINTLIPESISEIDTIAITQASIARESITGSAPQNKQTPSPKSLTKAVIPKLPLAKLIPIAIQARELACTSDTVNNELPDDGLAEEIEILKLELSLHKIESFAFSWFKKDIFNLEIEGFSTLHRFVQQQQADNFITKEEADDISTHIEMFEAILKTYNNLKNLISSQSIAARIAVLLNDSDKNKIAMQLSSQSQIQDMIKGINKKIAELKSQLESAQELISNTDTEIAEHKTQMQTSNLSEVSSYLFIKQCQLLPAKKTQADLIKSDINKLENVIPILSKQLKYLHQKINLRISLDTKVKKIYALIINNPTLAESYITKINELCNIDKEILVRMKEKIAIYNKRDLASNLGTELISTGAALEAEADAEVEAINLMPCRM